MAKFKDTEKAKVYTAKQPITTHIRKGSHKIHLYVTLFNTIVVLYLLFNKLF